MVLCSLYLVIAPFADYPLESFFCVLFILSGLPFYFAFVKYQILPKTWMVKYGINTLFFVEFIFLLLVELSQWAKSPKKQSVGVHF